MAAGGDDYGGSEDGNGEGESNGESEGKVNLRLVKDNVIDRAASLSKDAIQEPEWVIQLDVQTKTIQFIQDFGKQLPPDILEDLNLTVRSRLDISNERFDAIISLDKIEDVTEALRAKRFEPLRLPGEVIYPTSGWLGDYLLWSQGSEVPLAWHFWTAVAVMGASCRRNLHIPMGNHVVYPNHYCLFIGPTGMRKSTAIKTGRRIVDRLNHFLELADTPVHDRIRVIPEKVTPERFLSIMESHLVTDASGAVRRSESVALVCPDELAVLLGKNAFHSDVMIHLLTNLYDCPDEWQTSTITRETETLYNVALSFLAGSTPDWVRTSVSEDIFGGGFMGRCVLIFRESSGRRFPRPMPLDPVVRDELARRLISWVQLSRQEMPVVYEAWEDIYDPWYTDLKDRIEAGDTEHNMRGYFERKPTHVLRLAVVIALSKSELMISGDTMREAMDILDHEEKFIVEGIAEISIHPNAEKLARIRNIIHRNGNMISRSALYRKAHKFIGSAKEMDNAFEQLQRSGELQVAYDESARTTFLSLKKSETD